MSRIEFLGHATTVIEIDGVRIATDPLLRRRVSALVHRHAPAPGAAPPSIDAVLISHLHHDHLDLSSLSLLGAATRVVVPHRGAQLLRRRGFRAVDELRPGGQVDVAGVHVLATRALHFGYRAPFGPLGGCLGYVVEGSSRVYFAGDTQAFAEMAALAPIDVALMPIAGWGPVLGPGHMGPEAAIEALRLIQPTVAIPIHWGSLVPFGFHLRTWSYLTRPPRDFLELSRQRIPDVQVRILQPGESFSF